LSPQVNESALSINAALTPVREKLQREYIAMLEQKRHRIWATYSDQYAPNEVMEMLNVEYSRLGRELGECQMAAATGMYRGPVIDAAPSACEGDSQTRDCSLHQG